MAKARKNKNTEISVDQEVQELLTSQSEFASQETSQDDVIETSEVSENNTDIIIEVHPDEEIDVIATSETIPENSDNTIDTMTEVLTSAVFGADLSAEAGPVEFKQETVEYVEANAEIAESQGITIPRVGYKIIYKVGFNGVDRNGTHHRDGLHIMDLKVGRPYQFTINEFKKYFQYSKTATKAKKMDHWAEIRPNLNIEEIIQSKDNLFQSAASFNIGLILENGITAIDAIKKLMIEHGRSETEVLMEFGRQGFSLAQSTEHVNPLN